MKNWKRLAAGALLLVVGTAQAATVATVQNRYGTVYLTDDLAQLGTSYVVTAYSPGPYGTRYAGYWYFSPPKTQIVVTPNVGPNQYYDPCALKLKKAARTFHVPGAGSGQQATLKKMCWITKHPKEYVKELLNKPNTH